MAPRSVFGERMADPRHIWNTEFMSSRGTEMNLDPASPTNAFSRSVDVRDDGPVIPFGFLTGLTWAIDPLNHESTLYRASGPGFAPVVLRSVTTGMRSGMTDFPGSKFLQLSNCDLIIFLVGHPSPDLGFALSNPATLMDCASSASCLRSADRGLEFLNDCCWAVVKVPKQ
ncbi:hypothetical protein U1Q18_008939 [Sarracenia purpurea var. burkii]